MSYDQEQDPEVRADLELRDATERDRSRTRPSHKWLTDAKPSPDVAFWSCRNKACNAPVGVTQEGIEAFEVSNRRLRQLGEAPLRTDEIMVCPACLKLRNDKIAERNRERVDQLAVAIRKLKASAQPRSEHELLREIEKLRHPDIRGLLDALDPQDGKRKGKL